jgi:hypothetical protein
VNSLSFEIYHALPWFRYVKSRNDAQLRDASKANQTSACEPEKTTANGQPIVPCGLIAWSLFNDTYNFTRGNENLTVDKKDISWKSDREHKFGKDVYPSNFQNGALKGGATLNPKIPVRELLSCICNIIFLLMSIDFLFMWINKSIWVRNICGSYSCKLNVM